MTSADLIADAFQRVTPDIQAIYDEAKEETVQSVRTRHGTLAAASGAAAFAIPGLHLPAALADLVVLMNRMAVASYAIGTVKGVRAGRGNILAPEDFEKILALWSGHLDLDTLVGEPITAEARETQLEEAGTKVLSQVSMKHMSLAAGRRIGNALAARIGAMLGARFGGKALGGFVPLIGAAVGAGVNYRFIDSVCDSAELYYDWKIDPMARLTAVPGAQAGAAGTA